MKYTEYITAVDTIKRLLEKENISTKGFDETIANIKNSKDLIYKVKPIRLGLNGKFPRRLSHTGVKVLELSFDMNINGSFDKAIGGEDPFDSYAFNIVINGLDDSCTMLYNAMHLDRHDGSESLSFSFWRQ